MVTSSLFRTAYNDFQLIFRDVSLRIFFFMPVLIFCVVYFFCPYLQANYPAIAPYVKYIVILSCVQTSTMYGFIYSIVFLDERDTEVAKIYGILPISQNKLLIARLLLPYLLSALTTFLILLCQPLYELSVGGMLIFASLFAFFAPILALSVATLANTKMDGLTWYKGINILVTLPVLAFFVQDYAYAFSVLPTFWAYWSFYHFIEGQAFWWNLGVGFAFAIALLVALFYGFQRRHFQ